MENYSREVLGTLNCVNIKFQFCPVHKLYPNYIFFVFFPFISAQVVVVSHGTFICAFYLIPHNFGQ